MVITLLAIGFPLALVFSWVYEITPEGLRLEKDIDQSLPRAPSGGKALDRTIIALLALALGYFAFDKFVLEPERIIESSESAARSGAEHALEQENEAVLPDKTIAVLPFANMSPDPENEYFSDGLTEELIGALTKVNGLRVTARTSAFSFKGTNQDIREIGRRLDAGFHIWSETYDYELKSMLAMQATISRAIVNALQVQLSPQLDQHFSATDEVNSEAYDLYLKGRFYWARLSMGGFQQSIDGFQKAIAIDPGYAPPHAGLANAYSFAGYFGLMPPQEAFPLSVKEAELALAIDPASSEALVARGMAWLVYERDWSRARDDLSLAVKLSPNSSLAHRAYAEYLMVVDPAAAIDSALRALSLAPLLLPIMNLVAFT